MPCPVDLRASQLSFGEKRRYGQDMPEPRIWTAALLVIGDEILSGRTQDANVAQLAKWLNIPSTNMPGVLLIS